MWRKCCAFFKISPDNKSPDELVNLKYFQRPLHIYQAYAIYYMLVKEDGPENGGFLADEQGLGKTTTALGLCIIDRILRIAREGFNAALASKDKSHNRNRERGIECPTKPWAICCPCQDGPTALLFPKNGPTLVIVPRQLMKVWKEEFNALMLVKEGDKFIGKPAYDMRLIIRHGTDGDEITDGEFIALLNASESRSNLIVVTTSRSFQRHVEDVQGKKRSNGVGLFETNFTWKKNQGTKNIQPITNQRNSKTSMWALSGTPFEKSPNDLSGYIGALRKGSERAWKNNELLRECQQPEFAKIGKDYEKLIEIAEQGAETDGAALNSVLKRFGQVLKVLMIRRTMATKVRLHFSWTLGVKIREWPNFDSRWPETSGVIWLHMFSA